MSEYFQVSSPDKKLEGIQGEHSVVTEDLAEISEASLFEHTSTMDYVNDPPEQNHSQSSDMMPHETGLWSSNDSTFKENSSTEESAKLQCSGNVPIVSENIREEGIAHTEDELRLDLVCRLCAVPCYGSSPVFLFRHPPHHPEVLPKEVPSDHEEELVEDILSMIKATLPIKVSCCDKLPKQVCKMCVERLQLSYAFTTTVLKAESQLLSLRAQHKTTEALSDAKSSCNSAAPYDCPVCREIPTPMANQSGVQSSFTEFQGENYAWDSIVIKDEPEDTVEPSHEELEKSYNELFGGQKDTEPFRMEEKITLKPSKPSGLGGRRPRGRPRTRAPKVTPRGRRGRRSTQTTVEKILELSRSSPDNDAYGFRLCSRENNPATEALTQCLLCERWLPGAAACLQHSLVEHMDCGAFLCPRCPRDDFPGDFELIQHFQEKHCPDLELYEVFQSAKNDVVAHDSTHHKWQQEPEERIEPQRGGCGEAIAHCPQKGEVSNRVLETSQESAWNAEAMEVESSINNTLSNELDESQDEMSSNLSELAPRSLTSHSALYGEESNSMSTPGSDSNMASEDILTGPISDQHALHDELMCQPSSLTDDVSLSGSPCTLGVGDFASEEVEEECHNSDKGSDKVKILSGSECSNNLVGGNLHNQGSDFKSLQEDCQESQDSLKADELCGFQEAISEKSQEVSLNGSTIHFESDIS